MIREFEKALTRIKAMNINIDDLTEDQVAAFMYYNNLPYGSSLISRISLFTSIVALCFSIYHLIFGSNFFAAICFALFLGLTALAFASQYFYFKNRVLSDIQKRKNAH